MWGLDEYSPTQPRRDHMEYTEYDRDSEAIEPLVPDITEPTGETVAFTDNAAPDKDHRRNVDRSPHLTQTPYYTWDIEMIDPLVPIITLEKD